MTRKFSDIDAAMKMRDVITRIAEGAINRLRPDSFIAEVYDYNTISRKAWVRTAGMSDTEPLMEVSFTDAMTPQDSRKDALRGTIVEVQGVPGNLWIRRIMAGAWRQGKSSLVNARFNGGDFGHIERESQYLVYPSTLPALGNTIGLGRWTNEDKTFWSGGVAQLKVRINQELFTNIIKTYDILLPDHEADGQWKSVAPDTDSGSQAGVDFSLEIKIDGGKGFWLRVRRTRAGIYVPGGYYADVRVLGQNFSHDTTTVNLEEFDPRPTEFFGRGEVVRDELQAGQVNTGPFASGLKHTLEVRQHNNLITPTDLRWDGSSIRWTDAFKVVGIGQGDVSSSGILSIASPAVGTLVPIHGAASATTVLVSASGIYMRTENEDVALYYEPKFLSDGSSDTGRFHVVCKSRPFKVPSHWIMLAATNGTITGPGNGLLLGNGTTTDHWRNASYENNWTTYSGSFHPFQYRRIADQVQLRGMASPGTVNALMFILPVGFRPLEKQKLLPCITESKATGAASAGTAHTHSFSSAGARLNVGTTGNVSTSATASDTLWISIDGVVFEII